MLSILVSAVVPTVRIPEVRPGIGVANPVPHTATGLDPDFRPTDSGVAIEDEVDRPVGRLGANPFLGEVEVIELNNYILIKPKPQSIGANDLRTLAMAALHEAGLLTTLAWQPLSPVSAAERAELASRLRGARPLSEIIVEERADRV